MRDSQRIGNYLTQGARTALKFDPETDGFDLEVDNLPLTGPQMRRAWKKHDSPKTHEHVPGQRCQLCRPSPKAPGPLTPLQGPRDWTPRRAQPMRAPGRVTSSGRFRAALVPIVPFAGRGNGKTTMIRRSSSGD